MTLQLHTKFRDCGSYGSVYSNLLWRQKPRVDWNRLPQATIHQPSYHCNVQTNFGKWLQGYQPTYYLISATLTASLTTPPVKALFGVFRRFPTKTNVIHVNWRRLQSHHWLTIFVEWLTIESQKWQTLIHSANYIHNKQLGWNDARTQQLHRWLTVEVKVMHMCVSFKIGQ